MIRVIKIKTIGGQEFYCRTLQELSHFCKNFRNKHTDGKTITMAAISVFFTFMKREDYMKIPASEKSYEYFQG